MIENAKILFILFVLLWFAECKSEYPDEIVASNLENQYDEAKYQYYLLNLNEDCGCLGVVMKKNKLYDTIKLIDTDLKLKYFIEDKDSVFYSFSFSQNGRTVLGLNRKPYSACSAEALIIFKQNELTPNSAYIGNGYLDFRSSYYVVSPKNKTTT